MFDNCLFICVPNNSGSTFIYKAITNTCKVRYLPKEGQFIEGFTGPVPSNHGLMMHWGHHELFYKEYLTNPVRYNWDRTKEGWAEEMKGEGDLFVEKSPPNIGRVHLLRENFENTKFIFSVRNPYAVADGIFRAIGDKPPTKIAKHLVHVFEIQKENIEKYKDSSVFFTYENMCSNPVDVGELIATLDPSLTTIDLTKEVEVKNRYLAGATDYNSQQIANLTRQRINTMNKVFEQNLDIIQHFGYELI